MNISLWFGEFGIESHEKVTLLYLSLSLTKNEWQREGLG